MLKNGFYSAATADGPRDKKWLSAVIRTENDCCFRKIGTLCAFAYYKIETLLIVLDYVRRFEHHESEFHIPPTAGEIGGWPKLRFCLLSELVRILPICRFALNIRIVSAPFSNMFTRLRQLTGSGPFSVQFTIGAERNVRQWSEHHKTVCFSSNPRFWSSDLNIRMVSASLPNM